MNARVARVTFLFAIYGCFAYGGQLLTNGGFETGNLTGWTVTNHGEALGTLKTVFDRLSQTPVARHSPIASHQLFYLHSSQANAFATAGGRLYVTDELMGLVKGNEGIVAFVIGHEIAHNVQQHGIKEYLRADCARGTFARSDIVSRTVTRLPTGN